MKKIIFLCLFLSLFASSALAKETEVNFFYSSTCPHCVQEQKFLDQLEERYSEIEVNRFSISENVILLKKFYKDYDVPREYYGTIPITFIGEKYFVGFNDEIGEKIESCVSQKDNECIENSSDGLKLPFIGEINIEKYSLPVLAILLGFLDGFNICSLGALVLILGLVLALKSRKRVLFFGGIFILTTALMYGFLIVLWYKVFSFFTSYLSLMQFLIGVLGIGGAIYFLRQFLRFRKYGPTCEMNTGKGLMNKFSSRFKTSLQESRNVLLILISIVVFAAVITIVEFPCSAVVPVAFAGVLAQSGLSTFSYLLYISIFVVFYMIDEIIVFLVAFLTMKVWLASSKAITWITLLEAVILFALGIYYLFGLWG